MGQLDMSEDMQWSAEELKMPPIWNILIKLSWVMMFVIALFIYLALFYGSKF